MCRAEGLVTNFYRENLPAIFADVTVTAAFVTHAVAVVLVVFMCTLNLCLNRWLGCGGAHRCRPLRKFDKQRP